MKRANDTPVSLHTALGHCVLECFSTPSEWKSAPTSAEELEGLNRRSTLLIWYNDAVEVYCDREYFNSYNDDCHIMAHRGVLVTYPLWNFGCRQVWICEERMKLWNMIGRFCDVRKWTPVYVWLTSRNPELYPLRILFRQWALTLVWPRYALAKAKEQQKKARGE